MEVYVLIWSIVVVTTNGPVGTQRGITPVATRSQEFLSEKACYEAKTEILKWPFAFAFCTEGTITAILRAKIAPCLLFDRHQNGGRRKRPNASGPDDSQDQPDVALAECD
jgi:hypothetical protein